MKCRERLRLTPRAIQREHQLRVQTLAPGILTGSLSELGDQLAIKTEGQFGRDALVGRDELSLLESLDVHLRERVEVEVRERPAAPQTLRVAQRPYCALAVSVRVRPPPFREQLLKVVQVELA